MAKCKPGGKVLKFEPAGESFPYFDESRPLGSPPAGKVEEMRKYQKHNWITQDGKNPPAVLFCNIRNFLKYITSQQLLKNLTFPTKKDQKKNYNQHRKYLFKKFTIRTQFQTLPKAQRT